MKSYSELVRFSTFSDRFDYLSDINFVGEETFGNKRHLNQTLYHSNEWARIRRHVIVRDKGLDMGLEGFPIAGKVVVHHMNAIKAEDIMARSGLVFDPEFLICVSLDTHNAIHYSRVSPRQDNIVKRLPGDTKLW